MNSRTKIEWCQNPDGSPGYTWNPITGCLNGCDYCYARRLANTRLRDRYLANENYVYCGEGAGKYPSQDPFYPRFWPEKLYHAWGGKRKGIFVCDMSDLFGVGIPKEWTEKVLDLCRLHTENRYYLLTKQPQNLIKFSPFPDNCYVGVTATDDRMFRIAWNQLRQVEAKVKYISFEPLLNWDMGYFQSFPVWIEDVDWLIIGAQTKPDKPPKIEWVREIAGAANKAGIPVFLKDNLKPLVSKTGSYQELTHYGTNHLRQEMPK